MISRPLLYNLVADVCSIGNGGSIVAGVIKQCYHALLGFNTNLVESEENKLFHQKAPMI